MVAMAAVITATTASCKKDDDKFSLQGTYDGTVTVTIPGMMNDEEYDIIFNIHRNGDSTFLSTDLALDMMTIPVSIPLTGITSYSGATLAVQGISGITLNEGFGYNMAPTIIAVDGVGTFNLQGVPSNVAINSVNYSGYGGVISFLGESGAGAALYVTGTFVTPAGSIPVTLAIEGEKK